MIFKKTKQVLILSFLSLGLLSGPARAEKILGKDRFFLHGDGHVKIKSLYAGRYADVHYFTADGELNESAYLEIDRVFGFPTQVAGENVSRRTIAFLDHFVDQYNPEAIAEVISGYRSPTYNAKLRSMGRTAAKTSTHMDGMALDFQMKGVAGKGVWEKIREANCCGAGFYHGNFVHLDSGRPRFWTTATAKVNTGDSDFNRYIYVSTEYDRYASSEATRLFFTSISDFGFGVKSEIEFLKESGDKVLAKTSLKLRHAATQNADCLKINDRPQARFLDFTIPEKLKAGRYVIRVSFCEKTATEMPDDRLTNVIEVVK